MPWDSGGEGLEDTEREAVITSPNVVELPMSWEKAPSLNEGGAFQTKLMSSG